MKGFIDMHCHILPGTDDGAKDIEEMKKMLEIAYREGIRCIVATPHCRPGKERQDPEELKKKAACVQEAANTFDEKFRIFLGTEIYFGQDVPKLLSEERIMTMGQGRYVLVEFSPLDTYEYIKQGLQQVQLAGYHVVLAHVERYQCMTAHPELAEALVEMGIFLQVNAGSIIGDSGRKVKKFMAALLERELVFCVGTDAHSAGRRAPRMQKAAGYVRKKYGKEYTRRIFFSNARQMLRNTRQDGAK